MDTRPRLPMYEANIQAGLKAIKVARAAWARLHAAQRAYDRKLAKLSEDEQNEIKQRLGWTTLCFNDLGA